MVSPTPSSSSSSSSTSTNKQKQHLNQFNDSDDLLYSLAKYIRANEKGLKLGESTLYLNPSCLEHLNIYLSGKRVSFKVNKNELLDIQFIISLIRHLKLDSNIPEVLEKWKELDLTIFESLKVLEINYIKPALITNLLSISQFLTKISVHQSLYSLDELIVVEDEIKLKHFNEVKKLNFGQTDPLEIQNKRFQELYIRNNIWSKLAILDCSFNYIPKIDSSMYSLIALEKLNLEGNLIRTVENLHECLSLRMLNLSSNRISNLDNIHEILGFVTHLNLRNNVLTHVDGLCRLFGIEYLDISRNQIREIDEINKLKALPQLQCLNIEGNPLCEYKNYRGYILTSFFEDDMSLLGMKEFYLDGNSISQNDIEFIRKNSNTRHQSLRDLSTLTGPGAGSAKKKANKIKPLKDDEATPALFIAPNAKISRPESNNAPIVSRSSSAPKSSIMQRTVDLENNSGDSSAIYYENEATPEDKFEEENKLRKKINDLRNEGGNAWLRILNEMEHDPDIGDAVSKNLNNNNFDSSSSTTNNTSLVYNQPPPPLVVTEKRIIKKKIRKGVVKPRSSETSNNTPAPSIMATSPKAASPLSNPSSASPANNNTPSFSNSPTSSHTVIPEIQTTSTSTSTPTPTTPSSTLVVDENNNNNNNNNNIQTTPINSAPNSAPSSAPGSASNSTTSLPMISPISTAGLTDKPKMFNQNIKEEPVRSSPKEISPRKLRHKSEYVSKADIQALRETINHTTWTQETKPTAPTVAPVSNLPVSPTPEPAPQKPVNSLVDNPDSKLLCEPFFVSKYGNSQDILLELKSDVISETNPTTGVSIKSYLLNTIVFVKKYSRPMELIEITFGKDFKDGLPTEFFTEVYIMEDQDTANLLANTLRPLIKEYTMSCMDCSERYTCRDEHEFSQCVKCHSKYLFFVPSPKITAQPLSATEPINTPLSVTPNTMSASIQALLSSSQANDQTLFSSNKIDSNDDDFNNRVFSDQNLQLHFRLNLFTGGSQETYIYMMQSNYIRYNTQEEEKSIYLLLTSKTLYLLKKEKKIIGLDQGFVKVGAYSFKDIKKISIGLLYQFFRIELEDVCYVFLKRAHDPTHKFLDLLFDAAKKDGVQNLEPYFRIADTMFNINLITESKNDFQLFIMLHHKVSSSKTNPRSLIVTNDKLFMCQENYVQWPLLNKNLKTSAPQFTLVKSFKITDIINLQFNPVRPTELFINFDTESKEGLQQWNIATSHAVECKKIVSTLSKLWKKKFHLDLKINL